MSCAPTTGATADERDYSRFVTEIGDSRLQHGRFLPSQRAQSVPRHRSGRRLIFAPTAPISPTICASTSPGSAACLSVMSARSAARLGPRHALHLPRQRRRRAHNRARRRSRAAMPSGTRCAMRSRRRPSASIPISRRRRSPIIYSPAIDAKSIRPGTMIYDPNGHVATIYQGRARRAHPLHRRPSRQLADARLLRPALRARLSRHGRRLQELATGQARRRAPAGRRHAMSAATSSPRRTRRSRISPTSNFTAMARGPRTTTTGRMATSR